MRTAGSILWISPQAERAAAAAASASLLDVAWVRSVGEAAELPLAAFDAAVLDARDVPSARGQLASLRREAPLLPVLVRGPFDRAEREALRELGAAMVQDSAEARDGSGQEELLARLRELLRSTPSGPSRRAAGRDPERSPAGAPRAPKGLVGRSPAIRSVFALLERAARSQASVLLTGETGTGKELLARALHAARPRRAEPFVAANCAAFPEPLLESELFGHVRGAFTGADRSRKGLFEAAHGGTLFLDEVGETSPALQAKLLRALQEREIRPVGGTRPRRVDVRLVAATNRDLRRAVAQGRLREDLFYRLAVFPIRVPPLRDRREDVLPLAEHFLTRYGVRDGKLRCPLSREAADLLLAHAWPGNVRELENEIQRALALVDDGEAIAPEHLSEAWLVRRALAAHGGRRAATARSLGLTREGLYKKMKRLGIE